MAQKKQEKKKGTKGSVKRAAKKKPPAPKKRASVRAKASSVSAKALPPVSFRELNLKESAAAISLRLGAKGHEPLLVGQACAAIYSGGSVKARALEFAIRDFSIVEIRDIMKSLGFSPKETRTFINQQCAYEVTISSSPVSVGDDVINDARVFKTSLGPFRLLTPTDCVRQRLSMFYRWGDKQALAEAVQVSRRQNIDMDLVRRWSEWEWATDRFKEFAQALGQEGF